LQEPNGERRHSVQAEQHVDSEHPGLTATRGEYAAASTQSVAIIADAKSSKQTVEFEKKGEVWKTPSAGSAMSTISGSSDFCSNHLPTRAQIRNNS